MGSKASHVNQDKIDRTTRYIARQINRWLDGEPTGQMVLSTELNASQGGLSEITVEIKERRKL